LVQARGQVRNDQGGQLRIANLGSHRVGHEKQNESSATRVRARFGTFCVPSKVVENSERFHLIIIKVHQIFNNK
jgi:hypothetical protein